MGCVSSVEAVVFSHPCKLSQEVGRRVAGSAHIRTRTVSLAIKTTRADWFAIKSSERSCCRLKRGPLKCSPALSHVYPLATATEPISKHASARTVSIASMCDVSFNIHQFGDPEGLSLTDFPLSFLLLQVWLQIIFSYVVWRPILSTCRWFSDLSAASLMLQVLAYLQVVVFFFSIPH